MLARLRADRTLYFISSKKTKIDAIDQKKINKEYMKNKNALSVLIPTDTNTVKQKSPDQWPRLSLLCADIKTQFRQSLTALAASA